MKTQTSSIVPLFFAKWILQLNSEGENLGFLLLLHVDDDISKTLKLQQ